MKAAPQETIRKIFEYFELSTMSMEAVNRVLEKDSQAGSAVSRQALNHKQARLTDTQRADLFRELQAHPTVRTPDVVVPGTWIPVEQMG
jgi:hypothetical protein